MKYWIIVNDTRLGPMDLEQVINTPGFGPDTPIWHDGLSDWTTASRVPELAVLFSRPAPAQPYVHTYAPGSPAPAEEQQMPSTYLVWAVLSTLCCCLPTGIVALVYASKVSPLYLRGDYRGSREASEKACWWVIISFVAGLIWAPFSAIWSLLTM